MVVWEMAEYALRLFRRRKVSVLGKFSPAAKVEIMCGLGRETRRVGVEEVIRVDT